MSLRLLIAEDSSLFAAVLEDVFSSAPDLEVVAVATNGQEAVRLCAELRPDLVLMDIHMPLLDGLSATEQIMATTPTPILVITSDPHRGGVNLSFRALSLGALDLIAKPSALPMPADEHEALLRKVRLLAQIPVVRHVRGTRRTAARRTPLPHASHVGNLTDLGHAAPTDGAGAPATGDTGGVAASGGDLDGALMPPVVGIVASTGGPRALAKLFAELPADFPAALLVVQHISHGFSTHLARWLDAHSAIEVVEAHHGLIARPGRAYLAPCDTHMELGPDGRIELRADEPDGGHRPSGDRLLESLARVAAERSIGVVLSGMGTDGTRGMTALHEAGAPTLVQDEFSSVVYGMPRSALVRGVVDEVVALDALADTLSARLGVLATRRLRGGS